MLDLSKIESGKLELEMRPNDLFRLVSGVVTTFSPNAHSKNLSLELVADEAAIPELMFDRVRVRQVVVNLVGNGKCFFSLRLCRWIAPGVRVLVGHVRLRTTRMLGAIAKTFSVCIWSWGLSPKDPGHSERTPLDGPLRLGCWWDMCSCAATRMLGTIAKRFFGLHIWSLLFIA